nr:hypothetical protein [Tanacetum cinerariifolium]
MRELRCKLFKVTDVEDAHEHVRMVLEITDLFHFYGVTHDAVMLRVFPFTLMRPTLRWKNRHSAGSITTCDLLEKAFIRKYCPPFKTAMKLEKICNFKTRDGRGIVPCLGKDILKKQKANPYTTRETICMIGTPEKIHKMKAHEDEGDLDDD